ncbi:hypothetical protein ACL02S_22830 [Nocardia sp. 004]|uniref:hypothetical protein n=1 Tax=Nocardia sp. 004 TaxID=3385978 RepID=UPI0039A2B446
MGLLDAFGARHLTSDPEVWRPDAVNTFDVAAAETSRDGEKVWIRLHRSRWEGCVVSVWADWVGIHDEVATVRIPPGTRQRCEVTDGRYSEWITAEELWRDRRHPTPESGPCWQVPAVWQPGRHNIVIVAADDVSANPSGKSQRIVLRCSRWEGLHLDVPNFRVAAVGEHERRITLDRTQSHITLRGGKAPVVVTAQELFTDRAHPLPEPGPCLAVEQTEWLRLPIQACHLRRVTTQYGARRVLRFPRFADCWPQARVWLPRGFVEEREGVSTLRLPADHTVRVHTVDDAVVELPAPEFVGMVRPWAYITPTPTRGVETVDPDPVAPVTEVVIPYDLLDD